MSAPSGLKAIQARKRDLLLESELNRQVLQLELGQIGLRFDRVRRDLVTGPWKLGFALAGLLFALRLKRVKKVLGSSFGLFLLRRLWEYLSKSRQLEKRPRS